MLKKQTIIIIYLICINVLGVSQSAHYYYNGEKTSITLRVDKVSIFLPKGSVLNPPKTSEHYVLSKASFSDDMNTTALKNGTSMACPHVSGVAALLLAKNPYLTGQEVRDIIEKTAKKVGKTSYNTTSSRPNGTWNNKYGYGLVNAYNAVLNACTSVVFENKTITTNTEVNGCQIDIKKYQCQTRRKTENLRPREYRYIGIF